MTTAREMLAEEIADSAASLEWIAKTIKTKALVAPRSEPFLTVLIEEGLTPTNISLWQDETAFSFYNAKSFKAFEAVFEKLEPLGAKVENWKSTRSERTVTYSNQIEENFKLELQVVPDNELCKMVEVRREQVEKIIYEPRCTENLATAPAEETPE